MPFGIKPVCSSCKITSSPIWRKSCRGEVLCNSCGLKQVNGTSLASPPAPKPEPATSVKSNGGLKSSSSTVTTTAASSNGAPVLRKSARIKPTKKSAQASSKTLSAKGKGRRVIFKKNQPVKAPTSVATVVTGESVFHKVCLISTIRPGDVVSLVDHEGGLYYAQLRGFLSDQYNEKSAVITWLLPTVHSPHNKFDPSTYILGPEEDLPRKMDYMEFVCHAPSDYFRAHDAPYKTVNPEPKLCYIWTSIGPQIQTAPSIDEIFGISDNLSVSGASILGKLDRNQGKDSGVLPDRDKASRKQIKTESVDL
ncbi:unnamed protein product [Candidula unifasciata]|uniref:GATA zinc finger domain-containing protein 1 n=1 Tax=Candidula unifasciata TaxID=100452 RepID=A0A8S3ZSX1_9EUPU|nr:unnamed protein product [Candidula unifasciata]